MRKVELIVIGIVAVVVGLWLFKSQYEFMTNPDTRISNPCPPGYERCRSGDCRLASETHSFCN
jgi:hypothetical protein